MDNGALFTALKDASFYAFPDSEYNASLNTIDGLSRIVLRGVALDSSVNKNNWAIPENELQEIADRLVNKQIRIDHSQSIRDVKGRILKTEVDLPHSETKESWDLPNLYPHIHYEAELITNEANVLIPILSGFVDHGSIGVDSKSVFCSACGESTRPGRICECEGAYELVKNARVNEYSIVCSPAYDGTYFKPFESSEKSKECDDKEKDCDLEIDKNQEIACEADEKDVESTQEIASTIEENIKVDDHMVDEDNKLDSLIAMVQDLVKSNADLTASNRDLLDRIEAIEAEDLTASKGDDEDKEEDEDEKDASEEEAAEDVEEKEACSVKKKASKKKASNGMKDVPGERGDPEGEKKKEIKKSPIEAGVIIRSNFNSAVSDDPMEKAIKEVFSFAAKCNVFPIEG